MGAEGQPIVSTRSCFLVKLKSNESSDEHYKRSPDCVFFAFKPANSQKPPRARKGRQSKTQRLSTRSSTLVDTDTSNIPDFNDSVDVSLISQDTVISTASKMSTKGKKGAKGRGKNTRAKKADPVLVDTVDPEMDVTPQPLPKATRGKKRTSDEISQDDYDRRARESTVKPEPPPKRRATRSRDSSAQQVSYPSLAENTSEPLDVEEIAAKPALGSRKRSSSRTRKVSTASTASKASLRSIVPDEAEIDAALEAELDKPLSDEEDGKGELNVPAEDLPSKPQPKKGRGKGAAKKGAASTASTRRPRKGQTEDEPHIDTENQEVQLAPESVDVSMSGAEADVEPPKKTRATKTKKGNAGSKRAGKGPKDVDQSKPTDSSIITADSEASILAPVTEDDSGHETDASTVSRPRRQNGGRKKGLKGKKGIMSKNIEDIVQSSQQNVLFVEMEQNSQPASHAPHIPQQETLEQQAIADEQPKKTTRGKPKAKGSKAKKATKAPHLSMPGAFSPPPVEVTPDPEQNNETQDSVTEMLKAIVVPPALRGVGADQQIPLSLAQRLSMQSAISAEHAPLTKGQGAKNVKINASEESEHVQSPMNQDEVSQRNTTSSPKASTPLPSPQSSDAENQPPSARPESKRPPPPSPAKVTTTTTTRVPLAASTTTPSKKLSPSKQQGSNEIGGLMTSYPWDPVDVEMAFVQSATPGTENLLPPVFSKAIMTGGDAGTGAGAARLLSSPQKKMTVEQWVRWLAVKSEEELKSEGERVVGVFEREGGRAMRCLEGIGCVD